MIRNAIIGKSQAALTSLSSTTYIFSTLDIYYLGGCIATALTFVKNVSTPILAVVLSIFLVLLIFSSEWSSVRL